MATGAPVVARGLRAGRGAMRPRGPPPPSGPEQEWGLARGGQRETMRKPLSQAASLGFHA